jgi:hypothetical protein
MSAADLGFIMTAIQYAFERNELPPCSKPFIHLNDRFLSAHAESPALPDLWADANRLGNNTTILFLT